MTCSLGTLFAKLCADLLDHDHNPSEDQVQLLSLWLLPLHHQPRSWPFSAAVRGKVGQPPYPLKMPEVIKGPSEENALPRHFEQHPTDYLAYSVFLEDLKRIIDEEL